MSGMTEEQLRAYNKTCNDRCLGSGLYYTAKHMNANEQMLDAFLHLNDALYDQRRCPVVYSPEERKHMLVAYKTLGDKIVEFIKSTYEDKIAKNIADWSQSVKDELN